VTHRIFALHRTFTWLAIGLVFVTGLSAQTEQFTAKERAQGYRDRVLLAKPRATAAATVEAAESGEGLRMRQKFTRFGDLRVLELPDTESLDAAMARLRASGRYEYVERDRLLFKRTVPNDPSFADEWGLANTGGNGGTAGADIGAIVAWDTANDASGVIVAVIDSGIRQTHEDLVANLWTNPTPGTSGYYNDLHGINAIVPKTSLSAGNPEDNDGHGTHVSGTIGARGNNGVGTTGVAWKTQLMALKFLGADGSGSTSAAIACIDYAIAHGATVINASYGSPLYSTAEYEAIQRAREAGIVFVAAAGNDANNNDNMPDYPGSYDLDNIVTVAATTRSDTLAPFSNYGSGIVDLAAPGEEILSTYNGSDVSYRTLNGTSMAAPHVTGAVALLRTRFPNDTARQVINRLLRSVTPLPALSGKVQTGGRLNLANALGSTDSRPFNDDFASRAKLAGSSAYVRSSNVGATADAGEPQHAGTVGGRSLWWTWTAPTSGSAVVETAGSGFDTVVAVYTGTTVDGLQLVGANDDIDATTTASRVRIDATAGTTYQIALDGKNTASGSVVMKVRMIPANDAFANAQLVSGKSVTIRATLLDASTEPGEPSLGSIIAGNSIWYRWTAPTTGHYELAVYGIVIDPIAGVYTGTALSSLTKVASNDDISADLYDSLVSFNATAGVTYYLQVDHTLLDLSNGGEFILTVTDSAWQYPTEYEAVSSASVSADGAVFFGSRDGFVYALNPNGTRRWRATAGYTTFDAIDLSAPAIGSDGNVYVGSTDGYVYAFNGITGARVWRHATSSPITSSPAIAADGTVYLRDDTTLYALTSGTTSATRKWTVALSGSTYASPAIAADGTIYVGATAGKFYAVSPAGAVKWTFTADGDIYTTAAIAPDGSVYFATLTGTVYALNADGTQKWTWATPDADSISSSLAVAADGTLYFGAYDKKLHALRSDGAEIWACPLGDEVRASSPAIAADGTIYIGVYDGQVYAINPNGTVQRTFPTAGLIRSSPLLANGRLYFASTDFKLYAFDVGHGAAASAWPMFGQDVTRKGRAPASSIVLSSVTPAQTIGVGGTFTLSVTAAGNGSLGYQWFKDGLAITGATSSSYAAAGISAAAAGSYTVMVTGSQGAVTSAPILVTLAGAGGGPTISAQPVSQAAARGASVALNVSASGSPAIEWLRNGGLVTGGVGPQLTLADVQPSVTGTYLATLTDGSGSTTSRAAIVGILTAGKVIGNGSEIAANISHPNGNIFDQILLEGPAAAFTSDYAQNQITRLSYIDLSNDIVQVEFSGPGTVSIVLENPSGPAQPVNYNQSVLYVKGHAGIVVVGATQNTNLSVFSVGRGTASNSALFKDTVDYDGFADIAFVAIMSADGKFGGLRTANASYFATKGLTGVYAPGVQFTGPVFVGNINAFDAATPVLVLGSAAGETRITGGDLQQANGRAVQVSGLTQLKFTDGTTSHFVDASTTPSEFVPARANNARLEQNGVEVTSLVVVNPSP
jgi:subtilisin family serine protease/outer membrane protein assembly factor BamB